MRNRGDSRKKHEIAAIKGDGPIQEFTQR